MLRTRVQIVRVTPVPDGELHPHRRRRRALRTFPGAAIRAARLNVLAIAYE
jgi:hypothetical protein